nr:YkyA family protein [Fredinandcohnia sp. SECRCQ15]
MLTGCIGGPTPEEEIYKTLEKVVTLEKTFEEQQEPLIQLEKKERKLYDQIISLGMKEYDKIVSLSDEALNIVNERETKLNNEYESIKSSKEEFENAVKSINDIKDKDLKEEAEELVALMQKRYESYDKLYADYSEAINNDKLLYEMFKKEQLTLEELEGQINKINTIYEKVVSSNDLFNNVTNQYNEAKVNFYKQAGLKVVYGDEKE